MGKFFNNGSITMKLHILKVLYGLESHAKHGRCGFCRNEYIRRFVGKLVEKQTLESVLQIPHCQAKHVECTENPSTRMGLQGKYRSFG